MRVCFISFEYPPNILGGAGTYAETLVKGLRRRGIDTFVITKGNDHDAHEHTFRIPVANSEYWRRLFFMESALTLFHKLNNRYRFDLVHFNEPHVILGNLGLPIVCTIHSNQVNETKTKLRNMHTIADTKDLFLKSSIGSISDIFTAHAADRIICPSSDLAKLIESYCIVHDAKIHVIPNGIDLQTFDQIDDCDTRILERWSLEPDRYILFIGRLSVFKGAQYLIHAFRRIKKEYPDLKLVIVGTGDFENYLRGTANGLKDVLFAGYVDSPAVKKVLFENSLAVVVPSLYEALPMVVLEAMAYHKAVIASNVGGIPSLINHGKNGFLTRPGDSSDIERSIRILHDDKRLRHSMGKIGRILVEREFNLDTMVENTLKVYRSFN